MCGRVALFTPPERLARILDAACVAGLAGRDPSLWHPSYNVGPTSTLLGVTKGFPPGAPAGFPPGAPAGPPAEDPSGDREARVDPPHRVLAPCRWGLVPPWADDPRIGSRLFNARAETVATKPAFRSAFRRRRLVLPVDGFYEWGPSGRGRRPHYVRRADGAPVLLAGVWETWAPPPGEVPPGEVPPLQTCTVITTDAGADTGDIHDRMPVVLGADQVDDWIDPSPSDDVLASLLVPAPVGTLVHHPVGLRVGNVRNDGPDLIAPVPG
ncbi:MAG: SOS response-associated peptidase [Acidimicrobiales bacterium]